MNISTVDRVFENETWASMGSAISKAEGIGFCVCFALILISIVLGNLLTIILFAAKKRLRKKSLFLVVNMAFADLMLGAVSLPIYIYLLGKEHHLWKAQWSTSSERFYRFFDDLFMQASLISAAMISGERFYATYHPFKHRTLSQRAYRALICLTWILASIVSTILFVLFVTTSQRGFVVFLVALHCNYDLLNMWMEHRHLEKGSKRIYCFKTAKQSQSEQTPDKNFAFCVVYCSVILASVNRFERGRLRPSLDSKWTVLLLGEYVKFLQLFCKSHFYTLYEFLTLKTLYSCTVVEKSKHLTRLQVT